LAAHDLSFACRREDVRGIGIFGHYGNKNLGDEAIIEAVLFNLSTRMPQAKLCCFSINPDDSARRYGLEAHPIRRLAAKAGSSESHSHAAAQASGLALQPQCSPGWRQRLVGLPLLGPLLKAAARAKDLARVARQEASFLISSRRRLRGIDVLLVAGSNQFLDNFGGPWGFPVTLLKWTILARISGVKVFFVSVGAGPLDQPMSHRLIRWALRFPHYVSLRDESSAAMIRDIGVVAPLRVYPDLAHSLPIGAIAAAALPAGVTRHLLPVVGINPMPLYDPRYWCEKDDSRYQTYLRKMVTFVRRLMDAGYPFFLFATQEKDNNVIVDMLRELSALRGESMGFDEYVLTSHTVSGLMANIKAADITVATRFHGTVLSLHAGKPMLGVCYYRKAQELMAAYGQQDYAVDLDTFDVDDLWQRFERLGERRLEEQATIDKRNVEYHRTIQSQYELLFPVGQPEM
jgi:polysaccharide pyruvyl transferase WcaK-like protein